MAGTEPRLTLGEGPSEAPIEPPRDFFVSPPARSSAQRQAAERERRRVDEDLPPLFSLADFLVNAPSWLTSACFHALVIIILAMIIISPPKNEELFLQFDADKGETEDFLGDSAEALVDLDAGDLADALAPEELTASVATERVQSDVVSPLALEPIAAAAEPIRLALTGREAGMQQALLDAYGGTRGTQRAVMEALKWLARNQGKHGAWSMVGTYANGANTENEEAATALALLAFQGAGVTPNGDASEPFTKIVARGWTSLLNRQDENGNFFQTGESHGQLYTQALCTIALCELYGMTQDSRYREPAQRAIDYCAKIQSPEGGWRYFPGTGSDLSVTGWFVMAFQSARMAGLSLPSETLPRVDSFLDTVSRGGGSHYAYQPRDSKSLSMTAEGLLCRQYRGWARDDTRLQQGANTLIENLPHWDEGRRDVYYWYYATQVCHHMESGHWRTWNEVMREVLPANQVQEGNERGSWDPRGDRWGSAGGRLFITCLSTYMLEVYYRHLPIYQLKLLSGAPAR